MSKDKISVQEAVDLLGEHVKDLQQRVEQLENERESRRGQQQQMLDAIGAGMPIPLGTDTRFGVVKGVCSIEGERFYFTAAEGSTALLPADVVEKAIPKREGP